MDDRPVLMVNEGDLIGQRWTLDNDEMLIGRGSDADIVLPERQVSRYHSKILYRDGRYFLEDLDSKNGTFLNGQQVKGTAPLQDLQREAGFRTPGDPGPQINGVDAVPYRLAALPATDRAIETTRLWDTLRIDSRMLTTIDVSGSMLWAAGNTTRLELMQGALLNALGVLPDGSQIGSWVFSTDRASGSSRQGMALVRDP